MDGERIATGRLINLDVISLARLLHDSSGSSFHLQILSKEGQTAARGWESENKKSQQSWQRVKAINSPEKFPLLRGPQKKRWRNNFSCLLLAFYFQLQFMLTPPRPNKTRELVVKHFRNCFYVSVLSLSRCSSIFIEIEEIAVLRTRLGTFFPRKIVPHNFST